MALADDLLENGFSVVRGVYDAHDVRELSHALDRVQAQAARHPASWRHGNLLFALRARAGRPPLLWFVHWPAEIEATLERYRIDPRQLGLLAPLLGQDIKQIGNQASWKEPGEPDTAFGWHQDARFRRPAHAYRDLATSYVQVFLAIDGHDQENGCLQIVRGSHRRGLLPLPTESAVMDMAWGPEAVLALGFQPTDIVPIVLDPGDVALWLPHALHASGPNRSARERRAYVNGYVRAAACDRGAWAFRDGAPCPLGAPALIQYEELFTRPEPHYVDGPLYPPPP